jgi:hypothetical protein
MLVINIKSVVPILLFFNVRFFALVQTYIGFKIIEKAYLKRVEESKKFANNRPENKSHGELYLKLKEKISQI